MKKDFYTENAVVVLNDGETYSNINETHVALFKLPNNDFLQDFSDFDDFLSFDEEIVEGKCPKDILYSTVRIDFLLKFYLKHCEQHSDEL